MSIEISNVNKQFGDFVALDDVNVSLPTGQLTALLGPSGGGKSTLLRIIAGLEKADTGTISIEGVDATRTAAAEAQRRLRVPALRGLQAHDGRQERRVRPGDPQAARRPRSRTGSTSCSSSCTCRSSPTGCRPSSPAASASGWRWPGRSPSSPRCCCSTSRSVPSTPRSARSCATGCAACTTRCRSPRSSSPTTRRRRMEVADEIVVINDGRIEQVGTPDQLYDEPANDFVMGFLGEVTQLGEVRLRPHDIEIAATPDLAGATSGDDPPAAPGRLRGPPRRGPRRPGGLRGRPRPTPARSASRRAAGLAHARPGRATSRP